MYFSPSWARPVTGRSTGVGSGRSGRLPTASFARLGRTLGDFLPRSSETAPTTGGVGCLIVGATGFLASFFGAALTGGAAFFLVSLAAGALRGAGFFADGRFATGFFFV